MAMRSVGLDLGAREVSFCEVSKDGVVARRTAANLNGLRDLLGARTPPARVAIEACREAWHVHDVLTEWGHEVLLVDTTRARQIGIRQHGRKTDRLDAEALARAVERGGIPLAHILSPHRRELREKLATRRALVQTRAELIVTVRGIVRARGERLGGCDTEHFREKVKKASITAGTRQAIDPIVQVLNPLDLQLSTVEATLEKLSAKEPAIAHLTTAPGVSLIVAAAFVSVVDDAKRFRHAHQVESYLGLVPAEDTSGGRDKHRLGAITKCGNPYVRALLVQAAWGILRGRQDDPLRMWGQSLVKRRGKRVAAVALARRLAGVLWAMWRHDRVYDPALVGQASSRGLLGAAVSTESNARAMRNVAMKAARRLRTMNARLQEGRTTTN
jgi:transposase